MLHFTHELLECAFAKLEGEVVHVIPVILPEVVFHHVEVSDLH